MPFKDIQGHWFWYQSRAYSGLCISKYIVPRTVAKLLHSIGHIIAFDKGGASSACTVRSTEYMDGLAHNENSPRGDL